MQAEKTAPTNPMKELRIDKLVISASPCMLALVVR
jgi:hypothetical protein